MNQQYFPSINIDWDIDILQNSLKRGLDKKYNFYSIFLTSTDTNLITSNKIILYYIGSTRLESVSERLLNNHEALRLALKQFDNNILIALGEWDLSRFDNLKNANDYVRFIENGLIYNLEPVKNVQYKSNIEKTSIIINNRIRSFGGLFLAPFLVNNEILSIDKISFSQIVTKFLEQLDLSGKEKIIIQLMGYLDIYFSCLNKEIVLI